MFLFLRKSEKSQFRFSLNNEKSLDTYLIESVVMSDNTFEITKAASKVVLDSF